MDRNYGIFVLGYDNLIRGRFRKNDIIECDDVYEKCGEMFDEFETSDYNDNGSSGYECLEKFANETKFWWEEDDDVKSYIRDKILEAQKVVDFWLPAEDILNTVDRVETEIELLRGMLDMRFTKEDLKVIENWLSTTDGRFLTGACEYVLEVYDGK
jgi:hypothetical protein